MNKLTYANNQLSVWRIDTNTYWIQTRLPEHANKLAKLKNAHLVASGVNLYQRTYEVTNFDPKSLNRLLADLKPKSLLVTPF